VSCPSSVGNRGRFDDGVNDMAAGAKATEANAARRLQMLRAAAEVMSERGFADTRIADVAARSGASSALIIYYFGTRDRLLVDALRFSEAALFDQVQKMLAEVASVRERFSLLIRWTCLPHDTDLIPDIWGLWLDLWAQAFRREEVARGRAELDDRWRALIVEVVQAGRRDGDIGDVDPRRFAVTFAALLDGLSIQVALNDPEVDPQTVYEIAMGFAERELSLSAGAATASAPRGQRQPSPTC
jgi:AcrR family transcriptional regulator